MKAARIRSYLTAMVEAEASKGSGFDIRARLADFDGAAGRAAAEAAIRQIGGVAVPSGAYRVVFGPQAVNDLFTHLILPGLHASAFYQQGSPFQGKAGSVVAHPSLTVTDDGARPGAAGSKGITDEGLPAGRTRLIAQGRLVGLLTNWYDAQRLRHDHAAAQKLGLPAEAFAAGLVPRNGFRIEAGSGRSFSRQPGTAATNLFIQGEEPLPSEELLRRVGNGLYIGRIWYTYPINGLRAADFTSTVVGDSYVISRRPTTATPCAQSAADQRQRGAAAQSGIRRRAGRAPHHRLGRGRRHPRPGDRRRRSALPGHRRGADGRLILSSVYTNAMLGFRQMGRVMVGMVIERPALVVLGLLVTAALAVTACGGGKEETPPPAPRGDRAHSDRRARGR